MARPRKSYRGVLRRRLPDPSTTPVDEWCLALTERVFELYEHYDIDRTERGAAGKLVMELAFDHIEGFKISAAPGRRTDSAQITRDIILVIEVRKARSAGKPDSAAYRRLAKNWGVPDSTLRKRFGELMKPSSAAGSRVREMVNALTEESEEQTKKVAN